MIDLHMHTYFSDGTDTEIEILKNAKAKNLSIISITDHNTAKVYEALENVEINNYYNGRIIPGIELNTKALKVPIEILGYGIDYKKMNELVKKLYIPAEERNKIECERLYKKCMDIGIKLEKDCLSRYDGKAFTSKFIQEEIKKFSENESIIPSTFLNDTKTFYRMYMSNPEGPLYVEMDDFVPEFDEAANLVRECGGLVFIPHIFEYRENSEKILDYILKTYKIDGIECFYTTFTKEQSERLVELCKDRNLYMSGGSDYHGKAKPNVDLGVGFGEMRIEESIIDEWKNKVTYYK